MWSQTLTGSQIFLNFLKRSFRLISTVCKTARFISMGPAFDADAQSCWNRKRPNFFQKVRSMELSKSFYYAERFRVPFILNKEPRLAPNTSTDTNFTQYRQTSPVFLWTTKLRCNRLLHNLEVCSVWLQNFGDLNIHYPGPAGFT